MLNDPQINYIHTYSFSIIELPLLCDGTGNFYSIGLVNVFNVFIFPFHMLLQ